MLSRLQSDAESGGDSYRGLLIIDGDCGFCTRFADWVQRHRAELEVASWQKLGADGLGDFGLTVEDAQNFSLVDRRC